MWVVDGITFGKAGSGGTIDHDGRKHPFRDSQGGDWGIDDVHPAVWDPATRLRLMDELGIDAPVLYPNAIGIGGQHFHKSLSDERIARLCVELYNDAMADVQADSGHRLLPMPIMPAWDIDACVRGAERCAALGYRGVNMTADPQDTGTPDLGDPRGTRSGRPAPATSCPSTSTSAPARPPWPSSGPPTGRARTTT
jgi:hypothetical protein